MFRHRTAAGAARTGAVPLLLVGVTALMPLSAGPAHAHGAPTDPVSRVAACGPEGGRAAATEACRAAVTANDGRAFDAWDNMRIPNVNGQDRQAVPDGQLCSAGLDAYKGLDLPRADWPATTLEAGTAFTLTYRSTIPHEGTFLLYLTRQGYDPAAPLRWDDLDAQPFATATDPRLENGAYRISGTLPADRTGRHVLYTVWRNTSTPDTYYSCSDVVLPGQGQESGTGEDRGADQPGQAGQPGQQAPEQPLPSAPQPVITLPGPSKTDATSAPAAVAAPATPYPENTAARSAPGLPVPSVPPSDSSSAIQADPVPVGSQAEFMPVAAGGAAILAGVGVFLLRRRRAR
ncbi:lytic polysaccharide monooxygenase [Streptomyces sp. NPDC087658]|uniref:lytic polysaccharide monooxygenase auxiliary activity family 9 protein n=2 Tax=unclassified Streptomyces TaxID=2593676 RepID=UPI0037F68BDE